MDTYLKYVPFLVGKKSLIIRSAPPIELTSQPEQEAAYLSPRSSVRTIKINIFFRLSFASWESYGYYCDDRYRLLHCIISLFILNTAFLVSLGQLTSHLIHVRHGDWNDWMP